jgi:hypothetical protein
MTLTTDPAKGLPKIRDTIRNQPKHCHWRIFEDLDKAARSGDIGQIADMMAKWCYLRKSLLVEWREELHRNLINVSILDDGRLGAIVAGRVGK